MKIVLIVLLFSISALAQEHKSIHQIEWEQHQSLKKEMVSEDIYDPDIIPLNHDKASALSKKVFGFLPDWEYPNAMNNLRFDLLTHIAAFDFFVSPDGSIANPAGWPWTDLINQAHSNGVKVILTAVNFNGDQINTIITNENVKNAFFTNLKNKIELYSLDGVNIDFESLNSYDRGAPINTFMEELTAYLHENIPGSEVSFDGPAVNWGNNWDFAGLAASCDYIFIMGYAFAGSWSTVSGSTAPLVGGSINITNTILTQYAAVSNSTPEKLILGVPYYGNRFQTESGTAHSTVTDYLGSVLYRTAATEFNNYGTQWDAETQSPWYRYQSSGNWYQVWCENAQSMDDKFDLADSKELLGIGMWALNYDGSRTEFWNVIQQHYGSGIPLPAEPLNFRVTAVGDDALEVNFKVSDYAGGYWVYYGKDGIIFSDSVYFSGNSGNIESLETNQLYFIKVRAVNAAGLGSETGVLAATTHGDDRAAILIVDGFDRQANTVNPRNYIRMHAHSAFNQNLSIASATNEAVANGDIEMSVHPTVDWMLGDESTTNETFSPIEQAIVKEYLENGGNFFVSGAEIGWDLARGTADDISFYENYLKASYVDDAPQGENATYYSIDPYSGSRFQSLNVTNFDDGTHGTFDVDWPDAIKGANGGQLGFLYAGVPENMGGAGIYSSGKFGNSSKPANLVYLAVPFETIYPASARDSLFYAIINYFTTTSVEKNLTLNPHSFELLPNVPNPFNPGTRIRFYAPKPGQATIHIFNSDGKQIRTSDRISFSTGQQHWTWNGVNDFGKNAASGMYFYKITIKSGQNTEILNGKMILIR